MQMDFSQNTVLLVDDEDAVLNALYRLIRPLQATIIKTTSPQEGLEILSQQPVDLVISDMRMPEMSGECFLEKVAEQWPETERVVMTGYSDAQATIDAINRGRISRFMLKPWEDDEVLNVVRRSLELAQLKMENQTLQQETQQKNAALEELNHSLEAQVQARTEQIKVANENLKQSYRSVVRMFSTLTARRMGLKASADNQRLNQLLLGVATKCGIEGKALKQLFYAWQLRNIGKLSFSDNLLKIPFLKMTPDQQRLFQQHPILAQAHCMLVKPLYPAGSIILQHKEYLDGSGYPKQLKAAEISLSAQVLCVVNDYVELVTGLYSDRQYSTAEALSYLKETAVERYNDEAVAALEEMVEQLADKGKVRNDECIQSLDLKPGMMLSRDLISREGILLLSADQMLDETSVERIRELEFSLEEHFQIYVTR